MIAVSAGLFVTACAPPTPQTEAQDEVILVQMWLGYDAVDGKLIGVSSNEERVAPEDIRKKVLEHATSTDAPDAIELCEAESTEGTAHTNCELVFFTEDWLESEPLRTGAIRDTI